MAGPFVVLRAEPGIETRAKARGRIPKRCGGNAAALTRPAGFSAEGGALMIGFASLTAGVVLLLSLLGLATKGWLASRRVRKAAPARADEDVVEPCPEEFVQRVFSPADWGFVRSVRAGGI